LALFYAKTQNHPRSRTESKDDAQAVGSSRLPRRVLANSFAAREGPQLITRQGKEGVVMISDEQYERLVGKAHQPKNLLQFFQESPLVGVDLDLERDKDEGRDIEL
jgi:hypothetical protein